MAAMNFRSRQLAIVPPDEEKIELISALVPAPPPVIKRKR